MNTHPLYAAIKRRHATYVQDWAEQAQNDSEFGGAEFDANLARARALIARHGTQKFRRDLGRSGFGNNPEMIRFVLAVARELDARDHKREPKARSFEEWANQLYPTMSKPNR